MLILEHEAYIVFLKKIQSKKPDYEHFSDVKIQNEEASEIYYKLSGIEWFKFEEY